MKRLSQELREYQSQEELERYLESLSNKEVAEIIEELRKSKEHYKTELDSLRSRTKQF